MCLEAHPLFFRIRFESKRETKKMYQHATMSLTDYHIQLKECSVLESQNEFIFSNYDTRRMRQETGDELMMRLETNQLTQIESS